MPIEYAKNIRFLVTELAEGQISRSEQNIITAFRGAATLDVETAVNDIQQDHRISPDPGRQTTFHAVHYTSVATVISMLKRARHTSQDEENDVNAYLRMYSSVGFNDPGEGLYLAKIAKETAGIEDLVSLIDMDKGSSGAIGAEREYAYVASFIQLRGELDNEQAADDLVFWRGYGHEGTGCALTLTLNSDHFRRVKYGPAAVTETFVKLQRSLRPIIQETNILNDRFDGIDFTDILKDIIRLEMQGFHYLYKSEAYRYEQECRIVETPITIRTANIHPVFDHTGPLGFQSTKRYIEHPALTTRPRDGIFQSVSSITLGPCARPTRRR